METPAGDLRLSLDEQPENVDAWFNLGVTLEQQRRLDDAADCYRRVLELQPNHPTAIHNLCQLLWVSGLFDEAMARLRSFLNIQPESAEAINNLGIIHSALQHWNEAADCFDRAIQLKPDMVGAHVGRAHVRLLKGNYADGWPEYEWRRNTLARPVHHFSEAEWGGESLMGKTILLHAEQGLGDTIQFIRYALLVKRLGPTVIVGCQKPLMKLLQGCPGVDRLVTAGGQIPHFDFQIPLMSLPRVFQTRLATIPAFIPYLLADDALVAHWRSRLAELNGFRIAINWHGEAGKPDSPRRAVPLACFAPLADIPGVRLISVQKGAGQEELAAAPNELRVADLGDFDSEHGAFMDTAAIMKNVDLVITSDTSVAHLAGALGVPVWTLLPFSVDWRWLLNRSDSPWYPTMRLFRQKSLGDWNGVFEELRAALREKV